MQRFLLFRRDIIIIAVLVLFIIGVYAYFHLFMRRAGGVAEVSVDSVIIGTYPLDVDNTIELEHNTIVISGGEAYMYEADCPDKLCIKQGHIRYDGQSVVCLPNKVVVTVRLGKDSGVDDVAR